MARWEEEAHCAQAEQRGTLLTLPSVHPKLICNPGIQCEMSKCALITSEAGLKGLTHI